MADTVRACRDVAWPQGKSWAKEFRIDVSMESALCRALAQLTKQIDLFEIASLRVNADAPCQLPEPHEVLS